LGEPLPVTVRPMLGDRCPISLFVTLVYWSNGWMDQDTTWYGCRLRPTLHCVRWDPAPPMERGTTAPPLHFSVHVYCG